MHVCGDVSNINYRATYFIFVVMIITVCEGLPTSCML